ncbi:MAG: hypothetical protein Q4E99_05940 [Bacillota bacterium]|nr:hypothetical protein [Bacillota bacterium]
MNEKLEFLKRYAEICGENKNTIKKATEKCDNGEQLTFHDTIQIMFCLGDYTLITYSKGGEDEWCVAYKYDAKEKSWASGTYCYSLESALANMLYKANSDLVKSPHQVEIERKTGLTFERLDELATKFKDGLLEDDYEQAMIYFEEECEMTESEMEYLGLSEEE